MGHMKCISLLVLSTLFLISGCTSKAEIIETALQVNAGEEFTVETKCFNHKASDSELSATNTVLLEHIGQGRFIAKAEGVVSVELIQRGKVIDSCEITITAPAPAKPTAEKELIDQNAESDSEPESGDDTSTSEISADHSSDEPIRLEESSKPVQDSTTASNVQLSERKPDAEDQPSDAPHTPTKEDAPNWNHNYDGFPKYEGEKPGYVFQPAFGEYVKEETTHSDAKLPPPTEEQLAWGEVAWGSAANLTGDISRKDEIFMGVRTLDDYNALSPEDQEKWDEWVENLE